MSLFAIFVGPGPVFVSSAHDACSTVLGEGWGAEVQQTSILGAKFFAYIRILL